MTRTPRVYVGPHEIAGIAGLLVRGFHEIGIEAHLGLRAPHPFEYEPGAEMPLDLRVWRAIGRRRAGTDRHSRTRRVLWRGIHNSWAWFVLLRELRRSNAFVFIFGTSITDTTAELILLRLLRKTIIFFYVGSDARPAYISGLHRPVTDPAGLERLRRRASGQRRRVRRNDRFARYSVNSPSTAHFHLKPFVNWFWVGLPRTVRAEDLHPVDKREANSTVRILHSPSNPEGKGTAQIRQIVDALRRAGHDVEMTTLHGVPNAAVMSALQDCDLVVDQAFSDTPMAALAAESALSGRPCVVGGYAAAPADDPVGSAPRPPTAFVLPQEMHGAIEGLVRDRHHREALGLQAKAFVEQQWSASAVAGRLLLLLDGNPPPEWFSSPQDVRYVYGYGMDCEAVRQQVTALVARCGTSSLGLDDKPELRARFLALCAEPAE